MWVWPSGSLMALMTCIPVFPEYVQPILSSVLARQPPTSHIHAQLLDEADQTRSEDQGSTKQTEVHGIFAHDSDGCEELSGEDLSGASDERGPGHRIWKDSPTQEGIPL